MCAVKGNLGRCEYTEDEIELTPVEEDDPSIDPEGLRTS